MLRRRFDRLFLITLLAAGIGAACSGSDDPADEALADGGSESSSGTVTSSGASGTMASSGASGTSGTSSGASGGTGSSGASGTVSSSSGDIDLDASTDLDSALDAGEEPDVFVPDGPDVPPVAFPAATASLFGYKLTDVYPNQRLSSAMDIAWPPTGQPFILQRGGYIVRLNPPNEWGTVLLDFHDVTAEQGEGGTLGFALHPRFRAAQSPQNYVYIWYNARVGGGTRQRLSRFTYNTGTNVFDKASELVMVEQRESATEHNGAHVRFGPDGFLYFGNGDDNRPTVTPQRLDAGLFSGLFRIDVDNDPAKSHPRTRQPADCVTQGYGIPNDNPFVGVPNANEEYYALGFRNPYRLNFDRLTGALWMGDVGDSFREEVNQIVPGGNYGWPYYEGTKRASVAGEPTIGVRQSPRYEYPHHQLADLVSIVGGYVYRGAAMPELQGKYIYSDYPVGRVWALDTVTGVRTSLVEQNYQVSSPVGFAQDPAGELFLVGWDKLYKLAPDAPHAVPTKLSQTNVFRNLKTLLVPSSVKPYSIRSPLWSDGAAKQRWVYVPQGAGTGTVAANGRTTLPAGSLVIKQFSLPADSNPVGGRTRKLETRIMVVGATDTYGLTYRWNSAGTDADLVLEAADETIADADPSKSVDWHFPSFGECWSCHRKENRLLGFRGEQMNFDLDGQNQLAHLQAQGVFDGSIAASPAPLADPSDVNASLDARASAYLAANCSGCHNPTASYLGGGPTWNANPGVAVSSRGLVGVMHHNYPMAGLLGYGTRLITKGQPNQSVLMGRVRSTDPDLQMPPLGRRKVDPAGAALLQAWIEQMP